MREPVVVRRSRRSANIFVSNHLRVLDAELPRDPAVAVVGCSDAAPTSSMRKSQCKSPYGYAALLLYRYAALLLYGYAALC